jgi:hypothetical protein
MMGKAPQKKIVSVNFSHAVFFWIFLKMGPMGSPEMSVRNYYSTLRNIRRADIPRFGDAGHALAPCVPVPSASYVN